MQTAICVGFVKFSMGKMLRLHTQITSKGTDRFLRYQKTISEGREGAYVLAAVHARELVSIEENIENMEKILFIYNSPENVISKDEAKKIAEKNINKIGKE